MPKSEKKRDVEEHLSLSVMHQKMKQKNFYKEVINFTERELIYIHLAWRQ